MSHITILLLLNVLLLIKSGYGDTGDGENKAIQRNKVYCKRNEACLEDIVHDIEAKILSPTQGIVDPFFVDLVDANLSVLTYKLFNSTATGMRKCKLSNLRANTKDLSLNFQYNCPKNIRVEGDYETHGKLFNFDLNGKGSYNIVLGSLTSNVLLRLTENQGKDGIKYFKITTYEAKATVTSPFRLTVDNLFVGQKGLSEAFHTFVNTNWKAVADLIQQPLLETTWKRIFGHANKIFKTIPVEN